MIPLKALSNYFIFPQCAKSTDSMLVLGMNGSKDDQDKDVYKYGPVELMKPDRNDLRTTWRIYPAEQDGTWFILNNAFIGGGTGILAAPSNNSPVVMADEYIRPDAAPAHRFRPVPQGDGTWCALQLVENTDQNLNVAGEGPYPEGTTIYIYDWSGGSPNELWMFEEIQ